MVDSLSETAQNDVSLLHIKGSFGGIDKQIRRKYICGFCAGADCFY